MAAPHDPSRRLLPAGRHVPTPVSAARYEAVSQKLTEYFYDTDHAIPPDPVPDDPTRNNRLLWYTEMIGTDPRRTVWYTCYQVGHVSNITVKDEYIDAQTTPGEPADYGWYCDLAFDYYREQ